MPQHTTLNTLKKEIPHQCLLSEVGWLLKRPEGPWHGLLLVPAGVLCFTVFLLPSVSPGSLTICQIFTLFRESLRIPFGLWKWYFQMRRLTGSEAEPLQSRWRLEWGKSGYGRGRGAGIKDFTKNRPNPHLGVLRAIQKLDMLAHLSGCSLLLYKVEIKNS